MLFGFSRCISVGIHLHGWLVCRGLGMQLVIITFYSSWGCIGIILVITLEFKMITAQLRLFNFFLIYHAANPHIVVR